MGTGREIEIGDRTLIIHDHENLPDSLAGCWTWDCSLVLAQWLLMPSWPADSFTGKMVVELGAGTGIPGLTAAALGASVVLTDIPELLPGLQRNVDENGLQQRTTVKSLMWGDDCSPLSPPVDFVFMSDLLYDVKAMPALCKTLNHLADGRTQILLAYELRYGTTECFKALLEEGFRWTKVPQEELHPQWQSEDIGIFRVFKQN